MPADLTQQLRTQLKTALEHLQSLDRSRTKLANVGERLRARREAARQRAYERAYAAAAARAEQQHAGDESAMQQVRDSFGAQADAAAAGIRQNIQQQVADSNTSQVMNARIDDARRRYNPDFAPTTSGPTRGVSPETIARNFASPSLTRGQILADRQAQLYAGDAARQQRTQDSLARQRAATERLLARGELRPRPWDRPAEQMVQTAPVPAARDSVEQFLDTISEVNQRQRQLSQLDNSPLPVDVPERVAAPTRSTPVAAPMPPLPPLPQPALPGALAARAVNSLQPRLADNGASPRPRLPLAGMPPVPERQPSTRFKRQAYAMHPSLLSTMRSTDPTLGLMRPVPPSAPRAAVRPAVSNPSASFEQLRNLQYQPYPAASPAAVVAAPPVGPAQHQLMSFPEPPVAASPSVPRTAVSPQVQTTPPATPAGHYRPSNPISLGQGLGYTPARFNPTPAIPVRPAF